MTDAAGDLRLYLDMVAGGLTGELHIAIGENGHWGDGKYTFDAGDWGESHHHWPADANEVVDKILSAAAHSDVYVCVNLMWGDKRHRSSAVRLQSIHSDVDHGRLDLDKVRAVGGCAVGSGTPGNGHVYVDLADTITVPQHSALCRALGAYLGGADAKIAPNDVLRAPGTYSHKATPPNPVEWLVRPNGHRADPRVLAARLGLDWDSIDTTVATNGGKQSDPDAEPFDISAHPDVVKALAKRTVPEDKSDDLYRVIAACFDDGLSAGNARHAIASASDLDAALRKRPGDIPRIWTKLMAGTGPGGQPSAPQQSASPPQKFFDKHGLKALTLTQAVMRETTCGIGTLDGRLYVYGNGLWQPNDGRIQNTVINLLKERYRPSHCATVLDMIGYSSTLPRITRDAAPDWINVPNGMLHWGNGILHPHAPHYRSTAQLAVEYDPNADCPAFKQFLGEVVPADCLEFMWELIGYTLYSGNPFHVAVLLLGRGRNGKGVLIRVLKAILGEDNYCATTLHDLTENRFRAAELFGKIANLAGDLDSRWLSNTAMFKSITGNDPIQAERKYGHPFEFTPWCLPFYSANKPFGSADSSEGWVARWVVVPFLNTFDDNTKDPFLDAKLQTEGELRGILRHGVEALPKLMTRGHFDIPATVADAKDRFVTASDAVRSWVSEHCELDLDPNTTVWTARTDLYRSYKLATFGDKHQLSNREFYSRLEQINGIQRGKRGVDGFLGIRLRPLGTPQGGP